MWCAMVNCLRWTCAPSTSASAIRPLCDKFLNNTLDNRKTGVDGGETMPLWDLEDNISIRNKARTHAFNEPNKKVSTSDFILFLKNVKLLSQNTVKISHYLLSID